MFCRKCSWRITEYDMRCTICNAKQRGKRQRYENETTMTKSDNHTIRTISRVLLAIFVTIITGISIVMWVRITPSSSDFVDYEITMNESVPLTEFESLADLNPVAEIELLPNDLFLFNQANNTVAGMQLFVTEDSVYFTNGFHVYQTGDHFQTFEFVAKLAEHNWGWVESFYVSNDYINYTITIPGEEIDEWGATILETHLYQYSFATNQSQRIADNVYNAVFWRNYVFHTKTDLFPNGDDIYRIYLHTRERYLIVTDVLDFAIEPVNEWIVFRTPSWEDRRIYQVDLMGDNKSVLVENGSGFVIGNELIAFRDFDLEIADLSGNTTTTIDKNFDMWMSVFVGDWLIGRNSDDNLLMICVHGIETPRLLAKDIMRFAVIGNYIIYVSWSSWDNINLIDFNGNSQSLDHIFDIQWN